VDTPQTKPLVVAQGSTPKQLCRRKWSSKQTRQPHQSDILAITKTNPKGPDKEKRLDEGAANTPGNSHLHKERNKRTKRAKSRIKDHGKQKAQA
jgi:hypothetical protein